MDWLVASSFFFFEKGTRGSEFGAGHNQLNSTYTASSTLFTKVTR
jgi:hypothetical protein